MSNAWVTCLIQGDNSWKRLLIPDIQTFRHLLVWKVLAVGDGLASYQLVGGVVAYQGDDG